MFIAKKMFSLCAVSVAALSVGSNAIAQSRNFTPSYETAPAPIVRHDRTDGDTSWLNDTNINATAQKYLNKALRADGLRLEAIELQGTRAELRFRNNRYNVTPQALGRAARAMANVMPASVKTFVLTPVAEGIAASSVSFKRVDLESYENHPNGTELAFSAADISDAQPRSKDLAYDPALYPKFRWAIGPYIEFGQNGISSSKNYTVMARVRGDYTVAPGFTLSGSITKSLFDNVETSTPSASPIQHVRTDKGLYLSQGDPAIETLQAEYLFKPAPALYGRISAGYLERSFGGISGELLWKPAAQNWGLGLEVNHLKQRSFDKALAFQNYSVTSGHISAYLEFKGGISTQLDYGVYLAGDKGATLSIEKRFNNGWSASIYATKTDANVADPTKKGFRLTIPLNAIMKTPSRKKYDVAFGSTGGDAGSRLRVENRLYGLVREYHSTELADGWGRFWR